ncbi:MAG: polyprenyl synthetase family protein [Firmicutes bacterium]|nr:polyprenyl synthetase family protein [Bacillota bacterium]
MNLNELTYIANHGIIDILKDFSIPSNIVSKKLIAAMEYSLICKGKRLRPVMLLASFFDVCGLKKTNTYPIAIKYLVFAIEALHTYTLIHDDLPCLDNDDLRRGKPSSHKQFGEATALLAGDALLNASFEAFIEAIKLEPKLIHAANYFYSLSGAQGLIAGQSLEFELESFSNETLIQIFTHKTAALFRSAAYIGCTLGLIYSKKYDNKINPELKALDNFALNYGLAFQLKDDLDDLNPKGYAVRFGIENTKNLFNDYKLKAIESLKNYNFPFLTAIVNNL